MFYGLHNNLIIFYKIIYGSFAPIIIIIIIVIIILLVLTVSII